MGAPMAERLLDGGFGLRVFDPNPAAVAPLVARGAIAATSPRGAVTGVEIAFACLPSPEVSRNVGFGPDGVNTSKNLRIYVEMSTIGSSTIKAIADELAKSGITVLDSPVSGGPRGARAGTLATMVSGDRAAFDRVKPLYDAIARHAFYMGEAPGLAQVTKAANNMISAAAMAISCEATALAVKAGIDARLFIDVVNASTGRNTATTDKFPTSILTRTFDYGGKLSTMYKDVTLCLQEAKERDMPMWIGANVVQLWFHAMSQGRGNDDYTTIMKTIEEFAGVTVGGNE
jgi:3-hydroxyisobutyrate dehydrogenase-like beta-hydroxyacid dehydrogenase